MKVLIATQPFTGHINPMQPIAKELVERGHEVVWLTGEQFRREVELCGARFMATDKSAVFDAVPLTPDEGTSGLAAARSILRRLFVDRIVAQVTDYRRVLDVFAADVLLVDLCAMGAQTLHDLGGPVYATLGINPLVTADLKFRFIDRMINKFMHFISRKYVYSNLTLCVNQQREILGMAPLPKGKGFYEIAHSEFLHIMPTTLAFEFPRQNLKPQVHFTGPLLPLLDDESTTEFPPWWQEVTHGSRAVVHVTQGTYATNSANLIRPTIHGLANETDLLLVVTSPDADSAFSDTSPLPENVRIARFIPHARLLPYVKVMITNAGYNGVLASLSFGVPLVCAGRTEDKADVSSRVAWSGAGIDLKTDSPSESNIRDAVRRILVEPYFTSNARKIHEDFRKHDSAVEACVLLERLAEKN
ncbi:hypothetical protein POJ06DRAFT_281688 [Lipomyces tetrasporus]|uniref:Erythromycin biosynthesis protein CIII-like C-terminal domain-containing protein n=1 Tax=Lipomyces tetrasporus TaxID=54092 RepID=A0AAD7QSS5_9ASCO|nr:uncharacterized protein POJ06DRAFT_281688 [Lipomyces tetrasporus]KAJ8100739.1 hypothetical protein POJ06DRAFT_281688 [Lipomyces tetrasporus]